jgi:hypothetical protein
MAQKIKTFQLDIDSELFLNADPLHNLGAATKNYVDSINKLNLISETEYYKIFSNGLIYYSIDFGILYRNSVETFVLPIANRLGILINNFSDLNITNFDSKSITFTNTSNSDILLKFSGFGI